MDYLIEGVGVTEQILPMKSYLESKSKWKRVRLSWWEVLKLPWQLVDVSALF